MKPGTFFICILALFTVSLFSNDYRTISYVLTGVSMFRLIDKFGKGVILLEIILVYSCLIYLIAPILAYDIYNEKSAIAILWQKVMPVPEKSYFEYVMPAILAFGLGISFHPKQTPTADEMPNSLELVKAVKVKLLNAGQVGMVLMGLGLTFFFLKSFMPGAMQYVAQLFFYLLFTGILYVYFQPNFKAKTLVLTGAFLFIIFDAIRTGMFTTLVYMGVTIFSILLIGKKIKMQTKLLVMLLGIFLIMVIHLTKVGMRTSTSEGSRTDLFQELLVEKTGSLGSVFSEESFFPIYIRMNQGLNVCMVIRRIPYVQPYDDGKSIINSLLASFVPRFFWPDKPESGGVYNMKHFANFDLVGWSTNIGPVGEAYGNFGVEGGVIYMFFFGLFIRWAYFKVFQLAKRNPLFILWIPLLFFQVTYCMENDTLQAVNSLTKAAFFMWVLSRILPNLFVTKIKEGHIGS
jgi:hypothetical protein